MSEIYKNVVDYNYVNSFENSVLKEALVLPIKNDGIYSKFFVCSESKLELIDTGVAIEKIEVEKRTIEFFLSDIKNREKLYNSCEYLIKQEELNPNIIKDFFSYILRKALSLNSSDIHLESLENSMLIRFRIDGELKSFYIFRKELFKVLSSYIKMLAKLDVTKVRIPQDGRFSFENIDFRFSSIPTIDGESLVLRVLDNKLANLDLKSLEFSKHIIKDFKEILALKEGLVLITGPTGSGKTTTLYSLIKELNSEEKKIITIEDPVEYKIEQVQQVNINEEIDLSFNSVLKNILRQDPDIILIGEIRDAYSLSIALQASLTGHLVFASIHANSSVDTLSRLINLKANKYLLASTLKYIVSQRLVLKLCKDCLERGCAKCNFKGFIGRTSIAESLKLTKEIKELLMKDDFLIKIEKHLREKEHKYLIDDGHEKVDKRITTLKQLYKVVN